MTRKITLLVATAVVATTMAAAPAGAVPSDFQHGKQCNRSGDKADQNEVRCCIKKAKNPKDERRCIRHYV